jgi:hypothetical protein
MTKSLANKLRLKERLYTIHMSEEKNTHNNSQCPKVRNKEERKKK